MTLFGGIEAGGTKFICAIGNGPNELVAQTRFPTTTPEETLSQAAEFFIRFMEKSHTQLASIGIASFGPLDLIPGSPTYGYITSTPKPGWANVAIRDVLQARTGCPVVIDTDVNGAALGEGRWGAAQGLSDYVYLTIGTGIGGGLIVQNRPFHGMLHPEMGHIRLPHDLQKDPFPGICPFHGDCFEGLANGPALQARTGQKAELLPPEHPIWELEAEYIALALQSIICVTSPQRIILGGGVMKQSHLFPRIRAMTRNLLNGYIQAKAILDEIDSYIVPPALGEMAGVLGAIALAQHI